MSREWKPGDVAMVKSLDEWKRAIWSTDCNNGGVGGSHPSSPHWHVAAGRYIHGNRVARPLAVIDPEDREAVERLVGDYTERRRRINESDGRADDMQAALREFAEPKPPRPAEPTGLGAVVEDAEGRKYVRVAECFDGWMKDRDWQRIGGELNAERNFGWAAVNAVRVLSEGVTS